MIFLWICKIIQLIAVVVLAHVIKTIKIKNGRILDRLTYNYLKQAAMASKIVDCLVLLLQVPMICHYQSNYGDKYVTYYLASVLLTLYDLHLAN